jgi:hypothetical protein
MMQTSVNEYLIKARKLEAAPAAGDQYSRFGTDNSPIGTDSVGRLVMLAQTLGGEMMK